jgi:threonine/homoserine/homoserine lactone efflux protein
MIAWPGFLLTAFVVSAIPGANQLLGLRNAFRYGMFSALLAVLGRLAAFVVFIGLVVVGLGAVLTASEAAFTVIKWAGVAYLLWIGLTTLRRSLRDPGQATADGDGDADRPGVSRRYHQPQGDAAVRRAASAVHQPR